MSQELRKSLDNAKAWFLASLNDEAKAQLKALSRNDLGMANVTGYGTLIRNHLFYKNPGSAPWLNAVIPRYFCHINDVSGAILRGVWRELQRTRNGPEPLTGERGSAGDPVKPELPKNLDEAVAWVLARISDEQKAKLKVMPEEELGRTHFGLGMWIRNEMIYRNCKSPKEGWEVIETMFPGQFIHPDEVSSKIIEVVWRALQDK